MLPGDKRLPRSRDRKGGEQTAHTGTEEKEHTMRLEFSPDSFVRLSRLCDAGGGNSRVEVIGNAIRLYEWYLKKQEEGYKIALIDDKNRVLQDVELVF